MRGGGEGGEERETGRSREGVVRREGRNGYLSNESLFVFYIYKIFRKTW